MQVKCCKLKKKKNTNSMTNTLKNLLVFIKSRCYKGKRYCETSFQYKISIFYFLTLRACCNQVAD